MTKTILSLILACVAATSLACATVAPAQADEPAADETSVVDPGVRFARADLVDVATYVSDITGTGFVLADPGIRGLTMSLYLPNDAPPERVREMFLVALGGYGLSADKREGYYVIGSGPHTGGDEAAAVQIDFRDASLSDVAAFVSRVSGKSIVVASSAPRRNITIIAGGEVSRDDVLPLFMTTVEAEGITVEDRDGVLILQGSTKATLGGSPELDSSSLDRAAEKLSDAF